MLTPVRVRGKNKRDQSRKNKGDEKDSSSALPGPKRRPGRPRKSKSAAARSVIDKNVLLQADDHDASDAVTTYSFHLSTLEQLPTELLQTIFLLSRNINLPMSSLHLGSVLASPHLRTELVIHAFAERESSEQHRYAGLQSCLLRQKWLTYDFFQLCQKTYLLRHAILVIQKYYEEAAQDMYRSNVTRITKAFNTYYSLSHRILMKLDPLHHSHSLFSHAQDMNFSRDVVFVGTDQKGEAYSITLDNEGSLVEVFTPWVAHPEDNLWPSPEEYLDGAGKCYSLGSNLTECEIPEKLLHGPWTNERGYFLKLLLDANARVNWLGSTSGEIALQGFEDAIREENYCAIGVLRASGYSISKHILKDTRINTVRECLKDLRTGNLTVEDLTDPHASWRIPAGNAMRDTITAGVVPSTKHLKIAVFEKAANLKILKALLEGDGKTDIDCDDSELVDWALQKKAEARSIPLDVAGPNIGDWLLDTLELVRERQRKGYRDRLYWTLS
ncbi:hypothetical protein MMC17_008037 [Xylographa soralifera]|nr:hypothetical protein [Xylographa soralifera]